MKRFSYAMFISVLAISAVLILRTSATAFFIYDEGNSGNIFKLSYDELIGKFSALDGLIDPDNWPNQSEPDIEIGDTLPDFTGLNYLIVKWGTKSWIFIGDEVPTTWVGLSSAGVRGISSSSAPVPEPSTALLIGFGLLSLVFIRRRSQKE